MTAHAVTRRAESRVVPTAAVAAVLAVAAAGWLVLTAFFRHFAGSPATTLRVEVHGDHDNGRLRLRIVDTSDHSRSRHHGKAVIVNIADAYGPDRHVRFEGDEKIVVDTHHSGGWYDIALSSPSDMSFAYQLAGRLESAGRLTSDPQLGGASA